MYKVDYEDSVLVAELAVLKIGGDEFLDGFWLETMWGEAYFS